jgi:hypothetical protein
MKPPNRALGQMLLEGAQHPPRLGSSLKVLGLIDPTDDASRIGQNGGGNRKPGEPTPALGRQSNEPENRTARPAQHEAHAIGWDLNLLDSDNPKREGSVNDKKRDHTQ